LAGGGGRGAVPVPLLESLPELGYHQAEPGGGSLASGGAGVVPGVRAGGVQLRDGHPAPGENVAYPAAAGGGPAVPPPPSPSRAEDAGRAGEPAGGFVMEDALDRTFGSALDLSPRH